METFNNIFQLISDSRTFLSGASSSGAAQTASAQAMNYSLTSGSLSTLTALTNVTTSANSTYDPSVLTAHQADIQIAGMMALIQKILNDGNPTSADSKALLNWAIARINLLASKADPSFTTQIPIVEAFAESGNTAAMNRFMNTSDPTSGFSQIVTALSQFPINGDPSPKDDGSQLFAETLLYADLSASGSSAAESLGRSLFNFNAPNATVNTPTAMANFMALFLNSQTEFSTAQVALLINACTAPTGDAQTDAFLNQWKAFVPTGTTPLPQETLAQAQAAAANVWDNFTYAVNPFTNLTIQQSQMEVAGLISSLDLLLNNGASPAAIALVVSKLKALQADTRLNTAANDPNHVFPNLIAQALANASNPAAFSAWWTVSGPISQIISFYTTYASSTITAPRDDGTWMFAMISFFADLSSKQLGQQFNAAAFFSFDPADLDAPPENLYAAFIAVYLKQNGLSTADALSLDTAYTKSDPFAPIGDKHNPNISNFFEDLAGYINSTPPFTISQMETYTNPAWNDFLNQQS